MMKKINVAILRNESELDFKKWVTACEDLSDRVNYHIINLTTKNWIDEINTSKADIFLAKPGGLTASFKLLYDERIDIISNELKYKIFPSPLEIKIYENKRYFSYWLKANAIPSPKTHVIYHKDEAFRFAKETEYPIVAKVNIGASGSGVYVLKDKTTAFKYIEDTFNGPGSWERTGPNLEKGNLFGRGLNYLLKPQKIAGKLKIYKTRSNNLQRDFVIFQEFIQHEFEWRVVRIGDSFFAHKKLKLGEKASGSLMKEYCDPPQRLLSFVKELTDRYKLYSQAIDIFETKNDKYLINEMQCIFGQSDSFQMLVDGKPGRYRYIDNQWVFEMGDFAKNECFNLRLLYIYEQLNKQA